MRMAWGLTVFPLALGKGAVGTTLKARPNPCCSHSLVTPTHTPALLRYSTRIHAPCPPGTPTAFGGLVVISPSNGQPDQPYATFVTGLIGSTHPFTPLC